MPYTGAPLVSTYSQHTLPVSYTLSDPLTRGDTRYFVGLRNMLPVEVESSTGGQRQYEAVQRPCIPYSSLVGSPGDGACRGLYVWQKDSSSIYYFIVINNKVYTSTGGTSWANVTTLSNPGSATVGFTEFISSTNTKKLVLVDGYEGYVFTSDAAGVKITDADFPSPHLPYPVFLDGYLFLAKPDTADIYNSDLDNPANWTAGSFISSELYPDDVKGIAKINNYLLAIGTQGCEYFYDAANPIASPLARLEGAALPFGSFLPDTMAVNKNTIIMLANSNDGEMSLQLIENLQHKDITPSWLIPTLTKINGTVSVNPVELTSLKGMFVRINGDLCYILTLQG